MIGCLNIRGTYVTSSNSTDNNVLFFSVLNLKIIYYSKYQSSITIPWTREEYFASQPIRRQNHLKLSQNIYNPLIW